MVREGMYHGTCALFKDRSKAKPKQMKGKPLTTDDVLDVWSELQMRGEA